MCNGQPKFAQMRQYCAPAQFASATSVWYFSFFSLLLFSLGVAFAEIRKSFLTLRKSFNSTVGSLEVLESEGVGRSDPLYVSIRSILLRCS